MDKIKIVVCGAAGRMGQRILALAQADPDIVVAGEIEAAGSAVVENGLRRSADAAQAAAHGNVLIDFSTPEATLEHLSLAEKNGAAMVIGTTGFSVDGEKRIRAASAKIPVVFSPNYSVGVNIMFRIASEIARMVPGYDIEIVELHHNQKKDAPSGTAMKLAKVVADSLGRDIDAVGVYGRQGIVGARKKEEIGVLAVRAGDIVGDHTVYFAGPGERIELTHRAHSRDTLAAGALVAAKWATGRKSGLYTMQDVLGPMK